MLTVVKKQIKVTYLSVKYALMREMLNKTTFITNILFMILNNASFIIQWVVLYSLKDNVGGYAFKEVMLLWGLAAGSYGLAHFFFKKAFDLADTINNGKLDAYLVQPKNVLLSAITMDVTPSAIGDFIYAIIMLFLYGINLYTSILFILFCLLGALTLTSIAVILGSLSFWIQKSDAIADTGNGLMTQFATYPDGIFKGIVRVLLFTIIPVGIINYLPISIMNSFDLVTFMIVIVFNIFIISLAFMIFYRGLKRYSSSNLMLSRI